MTKYSVLIVDDNEDDRYLLSRSLKKTGLPLNILEATHGAEAIDLITDADRLKQACPDIEPPMVIFLDINMPIMNGWEFLDAFLKRRDEVILTPVVVIMFSTSDRKEDKEKVQSFDIVANYVVKGEHTTESLKEIILKCVGG